MDLQSQIKTQKHKRERIISRINDQLNLIEKKKLEQKEKENEYQELSEVKRQETKSLYSELEKVQEKKQEAVKQMQDIQQEHIDLEQNHTQVTDEINGVIISMKEKVEFYDQKTQLLQQEL